MDRVELIIKVPKSVPNPANTASLRLPFCAPIPGNRIGIVWSIERIY